MAVWSNGNAIFAYGRSEGRQRLNLDTVVMPLVYNNASVRKAAIATGQKNHRLKTLAFRPQGSVTDFSDDYLGRSGFITTYL